jgi:hypothetical protein
MKRLRLINVLPSLLGVIALVSYPVAALGLLPASRGLQLMYGAEVATLLAGLGSISFDRRRHTYRPVYLLNICWVLASAVFLARNLLEALSE